jgi:hypothetical protein
MARKATTRKTREYTFMNLIYISSADFVAKATAFVKEQPKTSAGLPTIPLLLFHSFEIERYAWYPLGVRQDVGNLVEHAMQKLQLAPIGAVLIIFEKRGERVHLAEHLPHFIDERLNVKDVDVLRGTVPYFMREHFGYDLGQITISDLTEN